ncbi:hypothetical protein IMSAGC013_02338 [Lachnospiraceae bacterium]|nr:hypothetical protein IMSAGC013_02338 [Lachnospiraceae bacterium]
MKMKNFAAMLLKDIEKSGLPIAEIKRIQSDKGLFAIETSDNSEFLIKIAKRDAKRETFFWRWMKQNADYMRFMKDMSAVGNMIKF